MHQRSLTRIYLQDGGVALSANVTTGTAVDLGNQTKGVASVGRREMRASFAVGGASTSITTINCVIQDNTTSTAADTGWANVTSSGGFSALTTNGHAADIFFQTNKRYVRSLLTPAFGVTTSYVAIVTIDVENRAS